MNVTVFTPTPAPVVTLVHAHEYVIVPVSFEVNAKFGVAVPVLVTAQAVNVGGVVSPPHSEGGNALQEPPYATESPSHIHSSGSSQIPFAVMIVDKLSERHCCHCAKTMLGFPPIHVDPSTSVHRSRYGTLQYSTLHVIPSAQTSPPTGGRIHWAS